MIYDRVKRIRRNSLIVRSMGPLQICVMAKYNEKKLSYALQEKLLTMFCQRLAKLKSGQAIRDFLKDLMNRKERLMLVRRLLIAEMLVKGRSYDEIKDQLRCGKTTIARVQRWLSFGRGGYVEAIKVGKRR